MTRMSLNPLKKASKRVRYDTDLAGCGIPLNNLLRRISIVVRDVRRLFKKPIEQYNHKGKKRVNNPPVGLVTPDTDKKMFSVVS